MHEVLYLEAAQARLAALRTADEADVDAVRADYICYGCDQDGAQLEAAARRSGGQYPRCTGPTGQHLMVTRRRGMTGKVPVDLQQLRGSGA
jgi:putative hemolysin